MTGDKVLAIISVVVLPKTIAATLSDHTHPIPSYQRHYPSEILISHSQHQML